MILRVEGEGRAVKILLVDDDAFSRKLMGYYLKPMEAVIDMASGGQECLDKVAESTPDLILMDCQMPDLDGFETVTRLRADGFEGVILALTGNSDPETLARCDQVGMNGHMGKPVDPNGLRERIQTAMEGALGAPSPGAGSAAPVAPGPPPPEAPSPLPPGEDPLARARSIATAARNPALMARLVAAFVKSAEDALAQLTQAREQSDAATVAAVAHRLRGSAGTFGATTFSVAAGELEDNLKTQDLSQCSPLVENILRLWTALKSHLETHGGTP